MSTLRIDVTAPLGIPPKPKGSMRHVGKGRMAEQVKGSKPWRTIVALAARQALNHNPAFKPLKAGAVHVTLVVRVPRPKTNTDRFPITRSSGDIDKHTRNVLDALVDAGVIGDDAQVVKIDVAKLFAHYPSLVGATVTVRPYDPDPMGPYARPVDGDGEVAA